ncbi:6526_t:CDS:1 [Acaulospora colombiana]|uniref:6526_t:CDS:1 n=1 Tax=Acaulospora colombiana TaxID=27376 RepID=A0ACA9PL63_9GLOM|nr:6526_t:CDS:1 [Acaulospora colombiana]
MALLKLLFTWALFAVMALAANPWVARHRLTSDQYQSTMNDLVAQGYKPTYVSGYTISNSPRFAAIWQKPSGWVPAWVARHGMTSDEYQAAFNTYTSQGYRPILVNGYTVSGQDRYVAIWDKSTSGAWVARHRMTASEYQSQFNTYLAQGYRLKHVSGYAIGTEARYAALWEKTPNDSSAWSARHGLTSAQYQQEFNTMTAQGYRPTVVSGYGVNGVDYYAAIWEKKSGPAWVARHGMTSDQYQTQFNTITGQGYYPTVVSGYTLGSTDYYAALWSK